MPKYTHYASGKTNKKKRLSVINVTAMNQTQNWNLYEFWEQQIQKSESCTNTKTQNTLLFLRG